MRPLIQQLEPRLLLAAAITPIGTQPAGALSGKIIFTSGGHGFTADFPGTGGWSTQRGLNNGMVEDFGNQEQMTAYVNYLFNAGATIVPMRPVGNQPNEVVLDNDSPGVTFTGTWSNSTGTIFYGTAGDVPYRFASTSTTETAVAKYTPSIPVAGFYPVYAWTADGTNRATDQLYRITHSGGAIEVKVNHRRVGKGWVYLGTYYFDQGTGGYVEVSNKSASTGSVAIADAIRFGNGMGDVDRGAGVSGHTREDEACLYWIMRSAGVGTPSSVYAPNGDDATDNVGAPIRWAAYMNAEAQGSPTDRIYLSFHSNAGNGTSRGTLGLYNSPANATFHQQAWAELVGREINDDLVLTGSPPLEFPWFNRTVVTLDRSDIDFGEINSNSINNEMDATIAEVAFHDNTSDAALLRDPKVRNLVGRAAYQATVRYFATYPNTTAVNLLPEPPTEVRAESINGAVLVRWNAPASNPAGGGAPTGYRLYASRNGYAFDGGIAISGAATTSYTFSNSQLDNGVYYFRVAAVNAGGESMPSEVVAARKSSVARPAVLIVNGFDRLDRTQDIRQSTSLNPGGAVVSVDRVRPRLANSFDYVVQVASAIVAAGGDVEISTVPNETVISGSAFLPNYAAVMWISGEESTVNHSFDATEQAKVKAYLDGGGQLFVSGSEIGWDLDAQANGVTFYNQSLKANYVTDDANTYSASGAAGSIFDGISLSFDNGNQFYDVDFPDVISPLGGASLAMSYATGGGAAIQYSSGSQ
ncbi:MAG TPA: LEPR-XLL domain-containing protein, partial [Tepidisphaeraceae bacterium]|nr:LEPR-XLL domain-containing protein [Tepidisphaeraceae bacterium]